MLLFFLPSGQLLLGVAAGGVVLVVAWCQCWCFRSLSFFCFNEILFLFFLWLANHMGNHMISCKHSCPCEHAPAALTNEIDDHIHFQLCVRDTRSNDPPLASWLLVFDRQRRCGGAMAWREIGGRRWTKQCGAHTGWPVDAGTVVG
jgi:hypothetical protein